MSKFVIGVQDGEVDPGLETFKSAHDDRTTRKARNQCRAAGFGLPGAPLRAATGSLALGDGFPTFRPILRPVFLTNECLYFTPGKYAGFLVCCSIATDFNRHWVKSLTLAPAGVSSRRGDRTVFQAAGASALSQHVRDLIEKGLQPGPARALRPQVVCRTQATGAGPPPLKPPQLCPWAEEDLVQGAGHCAKEGGALSLASLADSDACRSLAVSAITCAIKPCFSLAPGPETKKAFRRKPLFSTS